LTLASIEAFLDPVPEAVANRRFKKWNKSLFEAFKKLVSCNFLTQKRGMSLFGGVYAGRHAAQTLFFESIAAIAKITVRRERLVDKKQKFMEKI